MLHSDLDPRPGDWDVRMRRGHRITAPRSAGQGWRAAFTGHYDDPEIDLALSYITPGSVVLDVGACFGLWTVPLARESNALVVAFEPILRNCTVLERNIKLNNFTNVTLEPFGLGEETGSVRIAVEHAGVGNAGIIPDDDDLHWNISGKVTLTIPVRRLDDVPLPAGRVSFIKADVEGFEIEALNGARRLIAAHRPVIFGEFERAWWRGRGLPEDAAEKWAGLNGYCIYEVRHPVRHFLARQHPVHMCPLTGERTGAELLLVPEERDQPCLAQVPQ